MAPLLEGLEGCAFQSRFWLDCWYATFGADPRIEPLLLVVRDADEAVVMACPLIRRHEGALALIEFPDLGVSDYAAPLLRRERLGDLPRGEALWALVADALPDADVARFERLAPEVAGMPNPLYGLPRTRRNRLSGWSSPPLTTWADFQHGLSPRQQENSAKNLRRFLRQPGAEIVIHHDPAAAQAALERLNNLQQARISEKGLVYQLDTPAVAAFYRTLVARGAGSGEMVMVELRAGGEMIAANFAVLAAGEAIYLRVANRFGEWGKMSPGVIVTEQAIEEAIRRGARKFDFGMGDYVYKRRLGAVEMPLRDLVTPLSLRGAPYALLWHARQWASTNGLLRRLTGRAALGAVVAEADAGPRSSAAA